MYLDEKYYTSYNVKKILKVALATKALSKIEFNMLYATVEKYEFQPYSCNRLRIIYKSHINKFEEIKEALLKQISLKKQSKKIQKAFNDVSIEGYYIYDANSFLYQNNKSKAKGVIEIKNLNIWFGKKYIKKVSGGGIVLKLPKLLLEKLKDNKMISFIGAIPKNMPFNEKQKRLKDIQKEIRNMKYDDYFYIEKGLDIFKTILDFTDVQEESEMRLYYGIWS
jgi:archaellum component FlaF (FlaF/FlaG flagellin family)